MAHHEAAENHESTAHEAREVDPRLIVWSAVGLVVTVAVVCFIVWGVFNYFKMVGNREQRVSVMAPPSQLPPEPRIEVQPFLQLQQLRKRENQILSTYGWVDQKVGTVHIPIDKAMDELVQQGLPMRPEGTAMNGTHVTPKRANTPRQNVQSGT